MSEEVCYQWSGPTNVDDGGKDRFVVAKPEQVLLARMASAGFLIFIGWIIYLADRGQLGVFRVIVSAVPYGDKVGHVTLFGLLTLAANVGLGYRTIVVGKVVSLLGTLLVSVFVVVEEASQLFIPARTSDVFDLAANALGIGLATVVSYRLARGRGRSETLIGQPNP